MKLWPKGLGRKKRLHILAAAGSLVMLLTAYGLVIPALTLEEEAEGTTWTEEAPPEETTEEAPTEQPAEEAFSEDSFAEEPPGEDSAEQPPEEMVKDVSGEQPPEEAIEEAATDPPQEETPAEDASGEIPPEQPPLENLPEDSPTEQPPEELLEQPEEPLPMEPLPEEPPVEQLPPENIPELLPEEALPPEALAEAADDTAWNALVDSGYFTYWDEVLAARERSARKLALHAGSGENAPSGVQIQETGGERRNDEDGVAVSKTIAGTEIENVFDITLTVETTSSLSTLLKDPDMAVVIVMDISNTMKNSFGKTTRYEAAMQAAENFLDEFVKRTGEVSRIGYVAFNTDAHQIFPLQRCVDETTANTLKSKMRQSTGDIINSEDYGESGRRFTNIEAGLRMAQDMLSGVKNQNRFIIFLSDGFPTTYCSSGYTGYNPYVSGKGIFYDYVRGLDCPYGVSYSDRAAIRAREAAEEIKRSGVSIFSIGVDIGGQSIQRYIDQTEGENYSVVDRSSESYEIGSASSAEAYKNWLKERIGSGYYYDSTDITGLLNAYKQIFEAMEETVSEDTKAVWVTEDPMPVGSDGSNAVEFIGFFDQDSFLTPDDLHGSGAQDAENTAEFLRDSEAIRWDLKSSGFILSQDGGTTRYFYRLSYRVRLKNENAGFAEGSVYPTNGPTTLTYRVSTTAGGETVVSEDRTLDFPIPSVVGYLASFVFRKTDQNGSDVADAAFTLTHAGNCGLCRGDGSAVSLTPMTAVSSKDGTVRFARIPSGHRYVMEESTVPGGYRGTDGTVWSVSVSYGTITVTERTADGTEKGWTLDGTDTVINDALPAMPETGGSGRAGQYIVGAAVSILSASAILLRRGRKEGAA